MEKEKIKKVHVVFKTHLDIGFTDMAQSVLDKYTTDYIPHALELAEQMNTREHKEFIWTVGSYLIDYFLEHGTQENCENLKKAIVNGDICWHGLACTTSTELLDEDLLDFNLSISDRLDQMFGKKTMGTKMTDVPGHTKSMIHAMCAHGKKYLHIGVNGSSMLPEVPPTFVWKDGDEEIIVQYSFDYGTPCYVEGMDEVLEFVHTRDNRGPQSIEEIQTEMNKIREKYPKAEVVASTIDDYARELLKFKDNLPVLEEEIGDTWIHGVASDPVKTMRYRALLHLKDQWKARGLFEWDDPKFRDFMTNLMLVAEHTWGLDYKKYLFDFTNWTKEDLKKAREKDTTDSTFLTQRNAHILESLKGEMEKYRGGDFTGSYAAFEKSHEEQMDYIWKAVDSLPGDLKKEAENELKRLDMQRHRGYNETAHAGTMLYPYERVTVNGWTAAFGGNGEMVRLEKDGKDWLDKGKFGRLVYTIYNARDCMDDYYTYNRAFRENHCWAEPDFSKPGLEFVEGLEHRDYVFGVKEIRLCANKVYIHILGDETAVKTFSCPAEGVIVYTFEDEISCSVSWQKKDAGRIPEALWLEAQFGVENMYRWQMKKIGRMVSPLNVVRGGGRRQHSVESIHYSGGDGSLEVRNIHAPLISAGGLRLYGGCRELPDMSKGFAWCLFDNKWGTNYKMWCEDDCTFEFVIRAKTYPR